MIEDYASAASRHLRDARYLHEGERWDNAAYLAGYVAECAVKAVINQAGRAPQVHLRELTPPLLLLAADLGAAARRYRIDLDPDLHALRLAWSTDLRYARTDTCDEFGATQMLAQAGRVYQRTIQAMVLDGLYAQVLR